MSDSHKARYSTKGKLWKDSMQASRSQARARSKRKKRQHQVERARDKAMTRAELNDDG